jgi:hypothetical protein
MEIKAYPRAGGIPQHLGAGCTYGQLAVGEEQSVRGLGRDHTSVRRGECRQTDFGRYIYPYSQAHLMKRKAMDATTDFTLVEHERLRNLASDMVAPIAAARAEQVRQVQDVAARFTEDYSKSFANLVPDLPPIGGAVVEMATSMFAASLPSVTLSNQTIAAAVPSLGIGHAVAAQPGSTSWAITNLVADFDRARKASGWFSAVMPAAVALADRNPAALAAARFAPAITIGFEPIPRSWTYEIKGTLDAIGKIVPTDLGLGEGIAASIAQQLRGFDRAASLGAVFAASDALKAVTEQFRYLADVGALPAIVGLAKGPIVREWSLTSPLPADAAAADSDYWPTQADALTEFHTWLRTQRNFDPALAHCVCFLVALIVVWHTLKEHQYGYAALEIGLEVAGLMLWRMSQ